MLAKIVFSFLCMATIFAAFGLSKAWAAANSPVMPQRDAADKSTVNRIVSTIGEDAIFYFDHTTKLPKLVPLSTVSVPGPAGATGATGPAGPAGTNGTNGTNATTTATATTSVNGLMSASDKAKLDGVATGATSNATDAQLRDRSTHTGTQAILTVTGLQTALDGKENAGAAATAQAFSIQRANHTGTQSVSTITGNAFNGTTAKNGIFPVIKSANVASGQAVFHLTADGLSTGAALCNEVQQDSVSVIVNDATASYQFGWTFSNLNKTLTVIANRLGTANILTGILGQVAAPNGTPVKLTVLCN